MDNQNTDHFETLKELPAPLFQAQCVLHKHELLICGGYNQRACYSYHTIKNEYKFICEYPRDVELNGHCVVKLIGNNNKDSNQDTLFIWSNENEINKLDNYNKWIPFTDNHNNPIIIGRYNDNYWGVRGVIGGRNNHLLFITHYENNISVFNLNTFQFIKYHTLPIATNSWIWYHCFVSKSENGQGKEMMKTNQQNYTMLLFKENIGLSIRYDEDKNTFQFQQLHLCNDIASFNSYAYLCINDIILFFGGRSWNGSVISKSVHKYSIRENKWMTFQNILPSRLYNCVAILSEDYTYVHIIGGQNDKYITVSTHMKTKVRVWDASQLVIFFLIKYK
ncbi:hypothetical protein RFI_22363 [Reticulomyxa filosa]|uniref:Kelch motif family protein n=1 Tax=Reticulomyxa filosa TaxID=46433 RepID=X6MMX3_RETFI|nr:hypothetical protein RFI_22363 [Reticulomyxa filosa]|eukprot:ETO15006.1 hypothetical protein RFI_22363 [Reticulomyxa filosa]